MRTKPTHQQPRAVIYARYSSEKQQELSIEGQLRVCQEYCQARGWEVAQTYVDRALSASKGLDKRDAFRQMLADSAKGTFSLVVVYKLSRFARNRYDSAVSKRHLRANGVRVASATEAITDDPQGALLEGIMESLDEYYSKSLAQDVRRGMYDNATKALSTGGTIPLGYRSVNKQLVPDPVYAPVIHTIFTNYASGWSAQRIADDLNNRGFTTPKGKPFAKNSFHAILKNRKYIGEYHYNGQLAMPGAVPSLVSEDLFETVQRRIAAIRSAPAKSKATANYILTPKVFCGLCGAHIAGESGVSGSGTRYYYYTCGNRKRGKKCTLPNLKKEKLEAYVFLRVLDIITPQNIRLIAKQAMQEYTRITNDSSELAAARSRLKTTQTAIDRIIQSIESGISGASFVDRANALEQQKVAILSEIATLERGLPSLTERDIIQFLTVFLTDAANIDEILNILVNSVVVKSTSELSPDNISILLNLTGSHGEPVSCSDLHPLVHQLISNSNSFCFITINNNLLLVA